MNIRILASVVLKCFCIVSSVAEASAPSDASPASRESVEQLAFEVLLKDDKTEQVVKRDGPISVLATDKCGQHKELVEEAVADINEAFGYGKLALRWRDEVRTPKDDEIVFLLGSVSDGRLLIERAGVSSPGSFRSGSYRYWYKSHIYQSMTKGLIAIDDSLPSEDLRILTRKYLLSVLGFRGNSRNLRADESFFSSDHALGGRRRVGDSIERQMFTEVDSAMLRFSDRWLAPSMTWNRIRKTFDSRWSESVESFRNPRPTELKDRHFDEPQGRVTNTSSYNKQAESSPESRLPTKREAVLACDLVVSMESAQDETASVRLPKGSRGRIVEEQPDQILLFFGSDRLMYVPKAAVNPPQAAVPDEIRVKLLKPRDSTERIAANGMLEKRFKLNVNQMQLFRSSGGKKLHPVEAFSSAGVRFPEGSAAALTSPSELMVRTTPTMMTLVSAIMEAARSSY